MDIMSCLMRMWSVGIHMIVFVQQKLEMVLVAMTYVTSVERNGNGIITNDMHTEIEEEL